LQLSSFGYFSIFPLLNLWELYLPSLDRVSQVQSIFCFCFGAALEWFLLGYGTEYWQHQDYQIGRRAVAT
jgi:hypothetical protein